MSDSSVDDSIKAITDPNVYLNWFRHSSPYINNHRGKTFIVMLPGDCIDHSNFINIISDLTLLQSLGVKLVVVHGARPQIEKQLETQSSFHNGLRITPAKDMPEVLKAVGAIRFHLEASFSAGLPDSPMHGAKVRLRGGNFVTAMPQGVINGVDYQYTGRVRSIDTDAINHLLKQDSIVILSPVGYSLTGEVFNLSFAEIAVETAVSLGADKLIAYNDDATILDDKGNNVRELTLLKCEKFLVRQQKNTSNTYFSLRACHRACDGGVARAHVISLQEDGALLKELYTRDGSGLMVYRDNYESIRRARITDVIGILKLIEPLEKEGILVRRSRERLENEIQYFTVMEKDNLLIGCAGLYPIEQQQSAELACVVIHSDYRNGGRAAKLLTHIEKQALKLKIKLLVALTTQTSHWFIEQGFVEKSVEDLPEEKQSLYNFQRMSKVFVKSLI